MEVINKAHDSIFINERVKLAAYVKVEKKQMYFSSGAAREFGLSSGLKINFINDEDEWLFYLDNSKDGFDLIERKDKNAVLLCNAALVNLFLKRTRCKTPCKFPITLIQSKLYGHHIMKIEIKKPIEL